MDAASASTTRARIEKSINKCFLILDQIDETVFPMLEQAIFERNPNEIAKLDFVIHDRIQAVEQESERIHKLFNHLLRADLESCNLEITSNRIQQLKFEQKRIVRSFQAYRVKIAEKNRAEKEEEVLTRRITSMDTRIAAPADVSLDLTSTHSRLTPDSERQNKSPSKGSRNQKTLVKRVRTRYLNLSTNFVETSKMVFGQAGVDWILLFGLILVISTAIFCVVVWHTSPSSHN